MKAVTAATAGVVVASKVAAAIEKYFQNPLNVEYILDKTKGPNQSLKVYNMLGAVERTTADGRPESRLSTAVSMLKNDELLWNHSTWKMELLKIDEENEFLTCPYEVSEGVLTCRKCRSNKIFSYTKQTRSIDEPMTVFAKCSECGNRWSEGS